MNEIFRTQRRTHFSQEDPAGILLFANIFTLVHDAFEDFVTTALGVDWTDWFRGKKYIHPMRHAEADFRHPIQGGGTYDFVFRVSAIGDSTFQVECHIEKPGATPVLCAVVKHTHIHLDPGTRRKKTIPPELREQLARYQTSP